MAERRGGGFSAAQRRAIITRATSATVRAKVRGTAWISYTKLQYDAATKIFTVGAVLVCSCEKTMRWPAVVRIARMSSRLGHLRALGSDNGLSDIGAAWVFDGPAKSLPDGTAASSLQKLRGWYSHVLSRQRILRFQIDSPVPQGLREYDASPLFTVRFNVLEDPLGSY